MKGLLYTICLCLFQGLCQGQTGGGQVGAGQTDLLTAKGGGNGIFVFLSQRIPIAGITYTIERRGTGESSFTQIAVVQAPADLSSFTTRLREVSIANPLWEPVKERRVSLAWSTIQHTPDSARYYITSLQLQVAAGMVWFDGKVSKGVSYVYRVSMIDKVGGNRWEKTSAPVSYPEKIIYPMLSFSGYSFSLPDQCRISWKARSAVNAASFSLMRRGKDQSFYKRVPALIVRSVKGDSTFVTSIDTTAVAGKTYAYQLIAADAFGNVGGMTVAQRVITYDLQRVPLPQGLVTGSVDSAGGGAGNGIRISWTLKEPEYVLKTRVYRADNERGPYNLYTELPVAVRSFIDQHVEPARKYYYHLTLVGLMGEESAATINFPGVYYSGLPAAIPAVLQCQPLVNGVSLRFIARDKEVTGYRVYRCVGFRGVLQQVSSFIPAAGSVVQFIDSSGGLSGKQTYGYAVKAENSSHRLSGFSDTVYARPLIATVPPVPRDVVVMHADGVNKLFWQDMRMVEPTVVGYNVFRGVKKVGGAGNAGLAGDAGDAKLTGGPGVVGFQQLNRKLIPATSNSYVDSLTEKETDYAYYIQTADGFGGLSAGSLIRGTAVYSQERTIVPAPEGLSGYVTAAGAQLEWTAMNYPSLDAYRLYRYRRGETPLLLATVNKQDGLQYLDKGVEAGGLYFYYLIAVGEGGGVSGKGNEVSVRIGR